MWKLCLCQATALREPAMSISFPRHVGLISRNHGFSLLELLVATAVLMAILVTVLGLTSNTLSLSQLSTQRMDADMASRQIFDRLSSDFARAIIRQDLPPVLQNAPAGDEIRFAIETDGYEGDRGVSTVSYRIRDYKLERGVAGKYWEGDQLVFGGTTAPTVSDVQFEVLASQVFRFELAYLMKDGSIESAPGNSWDNISAVIVGIAILDDTARKKMTGSPASLASLFPDFSETASGQKPANILQQWSSVMTSPEFYQGDENFPAAVKSAIRIEQRYFPVKRAIN